MSSGRRAACSALSQVEVVETTNEVVCCVECGDELLAERAELGYTYCTKDACQAKHHRGLVVTTVGMNKSGDTVVVGDAAEIRERGEAGEFARKDTGLGLGYRPLGAGSRPVRRAPQSPPPRRNCAGVDGGAGAAGPHLPRHGTQPPADRRASPRERTAARDHRIACGSHPLRASSLIIRR